MPLEDALGERARRELGGLRRVRRPDTVDVFRRVAYIFPGDLRVAGYPRGPVAAFNPGAVVSGGRVLVFPRMVFDYYGYVSSIGLFQLDLEGLLSGAVEKPLEARLVLWPRELWEFKGCEDARAFCAGGRVLLLYTGYGYHPVGERLELKWVQGLAVLGEGLTPVSRRFFRIRGGDEVVAPRMKDSAFLEVKGARASMLLRPSLGEVEVCWSGWADLGEAIIDAESMRVALAPEDWEFKVGWSTNAVPLSSNEVLVGWHGVLKSDYSYREGLAVVSPEGDLLAVSDYLLAPRGLVEEYGDRPLVVFGCGLLLHRDQLVWIGGVSDYAVGVFAADLDRALERLHWLSG